MFGGWLFPRIDVEDGLNIGNIDTYHSAFQKEFLILNPLSHPQPPKGAWATFKTFNKDCVKNNRPLTNVPQRVDKDSNETPTTHESHLEENPFNHSREHINDGSFYKTRSGPLEISQHEHRGYLVWRKLIVLQATTRLQRSQRNPKQCETWEDFRAKFQ